MGFTQAQLSNSNSNLGNIEDLAHQETYDGHSELEEEMEHEMVDLTDDLKDRRFLYRLSPPPGLLEEANIEAPDTLTKRFMYELEKDYRLEVVELLRAEAIESHYTLELDLSKLLDSSSHLGNVLINYPSYCFPLLDTALFQLMELLELLSIEEDPLSIKPNAHIRITNVPNTGWLFRSAAPTSNDVGKLISLSATVVRTCEVRTVESIRYFRCPKCNENFAVRSEVDQGCQIPTPKTCLGDPECKSVKFHLIPESELGSTGSYRQYQEIKVQEQVSKLSLGTIPRSLIVVLEDDLVDIAKSGDDIIVTGVVRRRWGNAIPEERCRIELYFLANQIRVHNDARGGRAVSGEMAKVFERFWHEHRYFPLRGRDLILSSFCPGICGLHLVKLAVMLTLIGGVQKVSQSGQKVRGEPHLLLVGDPGTGKSQFLKFAAKVMPRSVLTTGIGSTSAGLTVTAVKDKGEWQLEAGALVLADRGLCCIDEFTSIREHDKASILEAMEQQSISVAKAGIVCNLNSRCSVLAATNPKGKYDPNETLSFNLALSSPLLSRFDLILILLDSQNEEWDKMISSFILSSECGQTSDSTPTTNPFASNTPHWSLAQLQAYITFTKNQFHPISTPESEQVLTQYYRHQRKTDTRSQARTTIRLLESLIRLSQAHARLMARNRVEVQDAVMVILLMEYSMIGTGAAVDGLVDHSIQNMLQRDGPEMPDNVYIDQEKVILHKLGLDRLYKPSNSEDEDNGHGVIGQLSGLSAYSQMRKNYSDNEDRQCSAKKNRR